MNISAIEWIILVMFGCLAILLAVVITAPDKN